MSPRATNLVLGVKPLEGSDRESNVVLKTVEEDVVVYSVKQSREVIQGLLGFQQLIEMLCVYKTKFGCSNRDAAVLAIMLTI